MGNHSNKILITGAGGFIGGSLFEKIRHLNPLGVVSHFNGAVNDKNLLEADLRDEGRVREILNRYKPSIIFHFAGFSSPQRNEKNPKLAQDSNIGITEKILNNLPDDTHIIFPSTDKVFDGTDPDPDEEARINPLWLYADLKYQCEKMIAKKTKRFHIVRLPIVHSRGEIIAANRGSFIDKAIIDLRAGKEVTVFKNIKRCFLRIEDLLDLFEVLLNDTNYGTYHVGTKLMSYFDRLSVLCDELGIDGRDKIIASEGMTNPLVQNLNTDKLKKTFGVVLT